MAKVHETLSSMAVQKRCEEIYNWLVERYGTTNLPNLAPDAVAVFSNPYTIAIEDLRQEVVDHFGNGQFKNEAAILERWTPKKADDGLWSAPFPEVIVRFIASSEGPATLTHRIGFSNLILYSQEPADILGKLMEEVTHLYHYLYRQKVNAPLASGFELEAIAAMIKLDMLSDFHEALHHQPIPREEVEKAAFYAIFNHDGMQDYYEGKGGRKPEYPESHQLVRDLWEQAKGYWKEEGLLGGRWKDFIQKQEIWPLDEKALRNLPKLLENYVIDIGDLPRAAAILQQRIVSRDHPPLLTESR